MSALHNDKHEKFVQELVKGKGQGEAYLAAGYTAKSVAVASAAATRLLKDARISARLNELRDLTKVRAIETASLSRAWVLEKLVENVNRALEAEPVRDAEGNPIGDYKYNGNVANRALELLGKEIGMFIDKKEIGAPGEFDKMGLDELREYVAGEAAALDIQKHSQRRSNGTKH